MNGLFSVNVRQLLEWSCMAIQELGYTLTVIEEDKVPLAPGNPGGPPHLLPVMTAIMALGILVMLTGSYLIRCRQYQQRIRQLGGIRTQIYCGFSLRRLKSSLAELEAELLDEECEKRKIGGNK